MLISDSFCIANVLFRILPFTNIFWIVRQNWTLKKKRTIARLLIHWCFSCWWCSYRIVRALWQWGDEDTWLLITVNNSICWAIFWILLNLTNVLLILSAYHCSRGQKPNKQVAKKCNFTLREDGGRSLGISTRVDFCSGDLLKFIIYQLPFFVKVVFFV